MANVVDIIVRAQDQASSPIKKLNSAFQSLTGVSLSGAGAIVAVGKAIIDTTKYASDLDETISKTNVVFGKASNAVIDFGEDSAKSLGMSKNAALTAASTYGNLFRSMGMAEEKSAEMSTSLVRLSADLASFNNLDPTQVFEKLRAGLTGEAEPLKSLGININETIIKTKAMELGLYDGEGAISASAKASAAYALILEQTSLAQGDFTRTASGLANQERIAAAEMENLKANVGELGQTIGVELMPWLIDATEALNDLLSQNKNIAKSVAETGVRVAQEGKTYEYYRDSVLGVLQANGKLSISQRNIIEGVQDGSLSMKTWGADYDRLIERTGLLTEAEFNQAASVDKATEAIIEQQEATEAMIKAEDDLGKAMLSITDKVMSADESYMESLQKIAETEYKTDEERIAAIQEVEAEHEKAKNSILLGYAEQILAADGLTTKEVEFLLEKGTALGVYEQDSVESMRAIMEEATNLTNTFNSIPTNVHTTVTTELVTNHVDNYFVYGSQGTAINRHASGGLFEIPASYGNEGFRLGNGDTASAGEGINIIPKSEMNKSSSNDALLVAIKMLPRQISRAMRQEAKHQW